MSGHGHAGALTAREEILSRVRKAIGRRPGQAPAAPPPALLQEGRIPRAERLTLFRHRLEALGGKVYAVSTLTQARDTIAEILGGASAVASGAPLLAEAGIPGLAGVASNFSTPAELRAACATAEFGITSADYGLAETGTLVTCSASEPRLISLLPPAHIALLPLSRLLSGLDELYSLLPKPSQETTSLVMITGPSRSADIEMILVRGVHGPRIIHVLVWEEG